MNFLDPEEERRRLTERYSAMNDGELEHVEADANELGEVAQQVLREEMERRGLSVPEAAAHPEEPGVDFQTLVTIQQFHGLPEAMLAKATLDSAGIECYLVDDNMVRIYGFISTLLGGVKLKVRVEDVEEASALLNEPIPESFEVEGVGSYEQPRCPKCNSLEINFTGLNKPVAFTSAWLIAPIPIGSNLWNCETCGAKWTEQKNKSIQQ